MKNNCVVIMAGGIGSRFWPLSRTSFPKQFLDIFGIKKTLLQITFERYVSYAPLEQIYVVTSKEYGHLVKEQLPQLPVENILLEPIKKNTAPCVAYITFKLFKINPQFVLFIVPSDHLIVENDILKKLSERAFDFAAHIDSILILGIQPNSPHIGYGYIQYDRSPITEKVYKVKIFTEKPPLELAKTFLESGDFLWNVGIFVVQVKNLVQSFKKNVPVIHDAFETYIDKLNTPEELTYVEEIYTLCPSISIDYAIMEKANNVYVIPANIGWSDIGSWNALYENMEKDSNANVFKNSKMISVFDTSGSFINIPKNKLALIQGVENMVIVDTNDVLLICNREKEQLLKEYINNIKNNKKGSEEYF